MPSTGAATLLTLHGSEIRVGMALNVAANLRSFGVEVMSEVPIEGASIKTRYVDEKTGVWHAISGVNVTLGLPILRTSVDHGTAFDIAGKGLANADSLVDAVDYAGKLIEGKLIQ